MAWWACNLFDGFLKILDGWHVTQFNLFHGMLCYIFLLLEHLVDGMVDLYVGLLYKIIFFISNCLLRMKISNYYNSRNIYQHRFITGTVVDTLVSVTALEPLLITSNYQQQFSNCYWWQLWTAAMFSVVVRPCRSRGWLDMHLITVTFRFWYETMSCSGSTTWNVLFVCLAYE
jgi:hypothetical protein